MLSTPKCLAFSISGIIIAYEKPQNCLYIVLDFQENVKVYGAPCYISRCTVIGLEYAMIKM